MHADESSLINCIESVQLSEKTSPGEGDCVTGSSLGDCIVGSSLGEEA